MNNFEYEYFECQCYSPDHIFRLMIEKDIDPDGFPPELYFEPQLTPLPFFKRLWRGIKYIIKPSCRYGHWDCICLTVDQIPKFRKMLDRFEELDNEWKEKQHD